MKRARSATPETPSEEPLTLFRDAVRNGDDWFEALLEAISLWQVPEEVVDGREFRYLIGGEAFDWLLLAERLCESLDGAISEDEREALLFFGRTPREMEDGSFKRAIGDAKHAAHLNFVYGITVEEALQLTVEEEVLKEQRSSIWNQGQSLQDQVFERVYGRSHGELLAAFRDERTLPPGDDISYGELRAFTYWLFKFRMKQSDPARVASDTRKALVQVSHLEAAARRRAQLLGETSIDEAKVVDGEVVAHVH